MNPRILKVLKIVGLVLLLLPVSVFVAWWALEFIFPEFLGMEEFADRYEIDSWVLSFLQIWLVISMLGTGILINLKRKDKPGNWGNYDSWP